MTHDDTGASQGDDEHDWVAVILAADAPGPIPPAVGARIGDSLRAAAGVTMTGERPQVFGGSAPARPSPFGGPPPRRDQMEHGAGTVDGAGSDTGTIAAVGGRSGSRRGLRDEAAQDRRHRLMYRLLPAAAAVVVVAGGAVVAVNVLGGGGSDDTDDSAVTFAQEESAGGGGGPVPNGLVATGTSYSEGDLGALALDLVTAVGAGDPGTTEEAAAAAPQSDAAGAAGDAPVSDDVDEAAGEVTDQAAEDAADPVAGSPLSSADAFRGCAQALGAPDDVLPVAVDLATFEGTEAAVVVLPNRAGDGYEVIVTDRACNPATQRATATVLAP